VTTQVVVRRATRGDLAAVVSLLAQLAPAWTASDAAPKVTTRDETVWDEILSDDRRIVLVADGTGGVVGLTDVVVIRSLLDGAVPHAILDGIVVDARARGQGIGRSLIDSARAAARDAGCCRLEFLSSKERTRAHAFYRAMGFEAAAEGFRANLDRSGSY
jgi:GNAT superfamily N-acetyltransferase